jgi:hypothetical protein
MRKKRLWGALLGMVMEVSVSAATPFTLPSEDRILPDKGVHVDDHQGCGQIGNRINFIC